ncbi:hypothetical protein QJS10_CPA05g01181 [Acorus calamus]|uniref:Cupin type-1 domain-containing protein n=1 Tax=Acorus calamus TaxID=4465 RepID=A0AAV9EWE4_ACOCL|nr:hypothetical protein QJS10_CPA05g01181 [Acorus calamus]
MNDGQAINNVPLFTKEGRRTIAFTESGRISAVDVDVGRRGSYHLEFITLEPDSLLLPLLLHTDMLFYVQSGNGTVSYIGEEKKNEIQVERGDVYRLESGSVFYVRSHADPTGVRLRIHAIFTDVFEDNPTAFVTPYSNLTDLVRGFDDPVLQMAFRVSPEVIQGIKSIKPTPSIIPCSTKNKTEVESGQPNWKEGIVKALIGGRRGAVDLDPNKSKKKKKKTKISNLLSMKPDFENCNGWSLSVTGKDLHALRGSNIGIFMVNLTKGSMMSPHWNPRASEIAIVTYGQGMVQVVCSGNNPPLSGDGKTRCRNMRFKVREGDVFVVPRYYPMAEISFNNDSLVFMGFSTMARKNHPQFLAGESVEKLMEEEEEGGEEEEGKRHEEEEAKKREAREEEKERGREKEEAGREEEEEQQRQRERQEEQEQKQRGREEEEGRREEEEEEEEEEREREEEEREGGGEEEEGEHESEEEQEARSKEEEGEQHREEVAVVVGREWCGRLEGDC